MVTCELNWYERISIWLRVGGVQAPNMRVASALYRVIEKVRPNEQERGEANLTTQPRGYEWRLPHVDYGTKSVTLDEEEAEQLAAVLENPPQEMPILVLDMAWILPLIGKLRVKEAEVVAA